VPGSLEWFAGLLAFRGIPPCSFNLSFNARSKSQALKLLEEHKSQVPASIHLFLRMAVEAIGPQTSQELRLIEIAASGHLADGSSYSVSSGTLKVNPIYTPD